MPAPIALFAYRRPDHLRRTLASLALNPEAAQSTVYAFSDAPKDARVASEIAEVRAILRDLRGFARVELVERDSNLGLARNITSGIGDVLARHDDVIVVEDDLEVSPYFLKFMNDGLARYRDEKRVATLTGYCYPVFRPLPETYLVRAGVSWGWATWRDRWANYNPDGAALLAALRARGLTRAFDCDGAMHFTRMLEDQIAGRNDSWAVRWYASFFLRDELALLPGRSLVDNIGNDGSAGTHTQRRTSVYDVRLSPSPVRVDAIPVVENAQARAAMAEFFRVTQRRFSRARKAWLKLTRALGRH